MFPKQPNPLEDIIKKKIREQVVDDDSTSDDSSEATGQHAVKKILQLMHFAESQKRY